MSYNSANGFSPTPPRPEAPIMIDPSRPAFRVTNPKGFFSRKHTLHKAGTPIYLAHDEEPNDGLWPLNELGFNAMIKFLQKVDAFGAKKAALDNKSYSSQESLFLHRWNYTQQQSVQGEVIGQPAQGPIGGTPVFPVLQGGADEIGGRANVPFMTGMPEVFGQAPAGPIGDALSSALQGSAAVQVHQGNSVRPGSQARAGASIDSINSALEA